MTAGGRLFLGYERKIPRLRAITVVCLSQMKKGEYVSQTSRTRFIIPSECTSNAHTVDLSESEQPYLMAMHTSNLLYYSERTDI